METNKIIQGDCFEIIKGIPDKSIDLILTDPPYGFGLDTWDKKIDIELFTKEMDRVIKDSGFYVFFGQMPTIVDWINETNKYFKFKEHITWVKRTCLPSYRLSRSHEEILIYAKDGTKFYNKKGRYEDIRLPGLEHATTNIESIKRYISALRQEINTKESPVIKVSHKQNKIYQRYSNGNGNHHSNYRAPEYINYTNVWSFLPENVRLRNKKEYGHPTQKPILLIKRLVEMLSLEDMIVLDPFLGSGTTAVACKELKRNFIGIEISEEYCKIAENRIKDIPETLFRRR